MSDLKQKLTFALHPEERLMETFQGKPRWRETFGIFARNKGALISLIFLALLIVLSILGPICSRYTYDGIDKEMAFTAFQEEGKWVYCNYEGFREEYLK